jgi:hypothetical protein
LGIHKRKPEILKGPDTPRNKEGQFKKEPTAEVFMALVDKYYFLSKHKKVILYGKECIKMVADHSPRWMMASHWMAVEYGKFGVFGPDREHLSKALWVRNKFKETIP